MKYIALVLVFILSAPTHAVLCDGLFVGTDTDMEDSVTQRKSLAKKLKSVGLDATSYVARWVAKHEKAKGPFTESGEMLVTGVTKKDYDKWMNTVGKFSVGIGVYGLPEDKTGTAYLRIGDKFLNHEMAAEGRRPKKFKTVFKRGEAWSLSYGLTEATIMMSKSEIEAILAFFKARGTSAIVAGKDIKGYEEGEILYPDFDHSGNNLLLESCAGACTSFLADHWLDNMKDQSLANRIRKIRHKYNLNFNYVARANVWQNFRNPAANITVMRIETSDKDLVDDFIGENSWGNIRGLFKYAFMPDGRPSNKARTHEVSSYRSQRISIEEYLEE